MSTDPHRLESLEEINRRVMIDWRADLQEIADLNATIDDLAAKIDQQGRLLDAANIAIHDRDEQIKKLESRLRAEETSHRVEMKQLLAENAHQASTLSSIMMNIRRTPDTHGMRAMVEALEAKNGHADDPRPLALQNNRESH